MLSATQIHVKIWPPNVSFHGNIILLCIFISDLLLKSIGLCKHGIDEQHDSTNYMKIWKLKMTVYLGGMHEIAHRPFNHYQWSEWKLPLRGRITYRHSRWPMHQSFLYSPNRLFGDGAADAANAAPTSASVCRRY